VRFTLKRPEAPFLADMAMDFASILSAEYFETMMKKGTPNAADAHPIGTGPGSSRLPEGRDDPLQGVRQALEGPPEGDTSSTRSPRRDARYAEAARPGECHVMAFPKPPNSRR
jgi:dipeptide transport system substrate-binding protein